LLTIMKWSILPIILSKFSKKKFYEIDPRLEAVGSCLVMGLFSAVFYLTMLSEMVLMTKSIYCLLVYQWSSAY
jgi:hypothetical protein